MRWELIGPAWEQTCRRQLLFRLAAMCMHNVHEPTLLMHEHAAEEYMSLSYSCTLQYKYSQYKSVHGSYIRHAVQVQSVQERAWLIH